MKKQWNYDHIVSIEIVEAKHKEQYIYEKESKKLFGLISTTEGFYDNIWGIKYSNESILNNFDNGGDQRYFIEDNKVYCCPYVLIRFVDDQQHIKRLRTIDECETYIKDLDINWSKFITF